MKLVLLLSGLVLAQAGVITDHCDGLTFDGVYHDKERLTDKEQDRPYYLTVDQHNDILYFNYNTESDSFAVTSLDLQTKELKPVQIDQGYAVTIDQATQTLYISSDNKIYKYNEKLNETTLLVDTGMTIWNVYFNNVLYFTTNPDQEYYVYKKDGFERFDDLKYTTALYFVIDPEGDMFYSNNTGVYGQKKGTKDAVLYALYPLYDVRQLTTDNNGKVYVCINDGIYVVNKEKTKLEKVVELDYPFGVTFDKDNNMIYSDESYVFRLKPNKDKNC